MNFRAHRTRLLGAALALAGLSRADGPEFNADSAWAYLQRQCAFGPRVPGTDAHRQCRDYVAQALREFGGEVFLQNFQAAPPLLGRSTPMTNVIARFRAEQGEAAGGAVMLCAHWDTRPTADQDSDPRRRRHPVPGANDGASGVAVLLEVARNLGRTPPPRTVIIALWDGEDAGRSSHPDEFALGSRWWAAHPLPEPVVEAVLLDMVGDADLEIPVERFSEAGAPSLRRRLWNLARRLDLPAFVERPGPGVQDDHLPLQGVGIPAVDLIDLDYPWWHTVSDTPDKCAPASLEQVGRLLMAYIYE